MNVRREERIFFFQLKFIQLFLCLKTVFETGDDITPCLSGNARTLFLSNHVNPEDIFLALDLLNSRPMLPKNIMWASFEPMKYVPVGIILQMRNDFFLKQVSLNHNHNEQIYMEFSIFSFREKSSVKKTYNTFKIICVKFSFRVVDS